MRRSSIGSPATCARRRHERRSVTGQIRRLPGRAARRLGRLFDAHSPLAPPGRQRLRAGRAERDRFARLAAARPISPLVTGPLVTVVVVGRDPEALPSWLSRIAAWTDYRPTELLTARTTSDGRAESVDALVARGQGELVCLLDPRARPVRPDWLGHLVGALEDDAAAVGPTLVRRPARGPVRYEQHSADLSVVSRGLDFARVDGIVRPAPIGLGSDPFAPGSERIEAVPGLSLACLLVRREQFLAAGGYPVGYLSDLDDAGPDGTLYAAADLACRLRADGRTFLLAGSALVSVRPMPAARNLAGRRAGKNPSRATRHGGSATDAETFNDRFGPRVRREVLDDILADRRQWSRRPIRLAFVGGPQLPVADERVLVVERASALASGEPWTADLDIVVVGALGTRIRELPGGIVRVAMVGGERQEPPEDLDDYDVVLAEDPTVATALERQRSKTIRVVDQVGDPVSAILSALAGWNIATKFAVRIEASNWPNADRWGDYHFARSLQRWLERSGQPTTVRLLQDWTSDAAARDDATIHLFGRHPARNRASQINVLWQISHPALATEELYDAYDLAFVASRQFAARMAAVTHIPVAPLLQATDPERFYPERTGPFHDVLFVANQRADRLVVQWLSGTDLDLAVYGKGWEDRLAPGILQGDRIPNDELHRYYSSATVVLNDTWADMRAEGFISNRVFDALASGAFVISDDIAGLTEELAGAVPVYRDAMELRRLIDEALAAPEHSRVRAAEGRKIVLERHTFEQRAGTIVAAVRSRARDRPVRLTVGQPARR